MTRKPGAFYYRHASWMGLRFEVLTRKDDQLVCLANTEARAAQIVRALNAMGEDALRRSDRKCGPLSCLGMSMLLSLIGGVLTAVVAYVVWVWERL